MRTTKLEYLIHYTEVYRLVEGLELDPVGHHIRVRIQTAELAWYLTIFMIFVGVYIRDIPGCQYCRHQVLDSVPNFYLLQTCLDVKST